MRKKRSRLNTLRTEREKTRLNIDKIKLAESDPSHLSFADQARQMSQTEFMQYCPPSTKEEDRDYGIRQAKSVRLWVQEYAKLLLLMYDQNLANDETGHYNIMKEWSTALVDQDTMNEMITRRNLYPTSRFERFPELGGELDHLASPDDVIYE